MSSCSPTRSEVKVQTSFEHGLAMGYWWGRLDSASYDLCAKALQELAARQQIPASAVQATVWLVWKSMTNRRSENGKNPMEKMS